MEKTWRWFGKKDPITLDMLRQIGVEGIVAALHDIPNGEIWPLEAIVELRDYIERAGLRWSVVESLPVSEAIKYGGKERDRLIENYGISLANLSKAGIKTVCYNFMPVIDWIRTDLNHRWEDGSSSLYFDKIRFAYFDCWILQRKGAEADYTAEELQKVDELAKTITDEEKYELIDTVIVKTQGFVNGNIDGHTPDPVQLFRELLSRYEGIDAISCVTTCVISCRLSCLSAMLAAWICVYIPMIRLIRCWDCLVLSLRVKTSTGCSRQWTILTTG